jgi:hypothetical protein
MANTLAYHRFNTIFLDFIELALGQRPLIKWILKIEKTE